MSIVQRYAIISTLAVLTPVGTILNLIIIITIARNKKLYTSTYMLYLNLALCDTLIALLGGTSAIAVYISGDYIYCQCAAASAMITYIISIGTVTLISYDRFIYLQKPLLYYRKMTKKRVYIAISLLWLVSVGNFVAPLLTDTAFVRNESIIGALNAKNCVLSRLMRREYLLWTTLVMVSIPTCIAAILNIRIFKIATKHHIKIQKTKYNFQEYYNETSTKQEDMTTRIANKTCNKATSTQENITTETDNTIAQTTTELKSMGPLDSDMSNPLAGTLTTENNNATYANHLVDKSVSTNNNSTLESTNHLAGSSNNITNSTLESTNHLGTNHLANNSNSTNNSIYETTVGVADTTAFKNGILEPTSHFPNILIKKNTVNQSNGTINSTSIINEINEQQEMITGLDNIELSMRVESTFHKKNDTKDDISTSVNTNKMKTQTGVNTSNEMTITNNTNTTKRCLKKTNRKPYTLNIQKSSTNTKAMRTTICLVTANLGCTLPYIFVLIIEASCNYCIKYQNMRYSYSLFLLNYFATIMNPLIFTLTNTELRNEVRKFLSACFHTCKAVSNNTKSGPSRPRANTETSSISSNHSSTLSINKSLDENVNKNYKTNGILIKEDQKTRGNTVRRVSFQLDQIEENETHKMSSISEELE